VSLRAAALRTVLRPPILTRSLWVAVVVGSILNLINQGDRLAAGAPLDWGKLTLTFVVPFLVASFGAWSALSSRSEG
jgi:hypothetical protein